MQPNTQIIERIIISCSVHKYQIRSLIADHNIQKTNFLLCGMAYLRSGPKNYSRNSQRMIISQNVTQRHFLT